MPDTPPTSAATKPHAVGAFVCTAPDVDVADKPEGWTSDKSRLAALRDAVVTWWKVRPYV